MKVLFTIPFCLLLCSPALAEGKSRRAKPRVVVAADALPSVPRQPAAVTSMEATLNNEFSKKVANGGWLLGTVGFASHKYVETNRADFSTVDLAVGVEAESRLKSGFAFGGSTELGIATINNSTAPEAPGYANVHLRAGYLVPVERWDFGLYTGVEVRTMLGKTKAYGYERLVEPLLFPTVSYYVTSRMLLKGTVRFAPILTTSLTLADRELAAQAALLYRLKSNKHVGVLLGYSSLRFHVNKVHVDASELSLRFAFGW